MAVRRGIEPSHAKPKRASGLLGLVTAFADARAVAFDLDCTLVDVLAVKRAGAQAAARALGLGAVDADALFALLLAAGLDVREPVALWRGARAADVVAAERAFRDAEDAASVAYAGARSTLAALSARGFALAVVTDAPRAFAERRLRAAGLRDAFPVLVAGEDSPRGKADARPFRLAAEALGLATRDLVMVGDNPARDVGAARAAGCRAVLAAYGLQPWLAGDLARHAPDASIGALPDLLALLPASVRKDDGAAALTGAEAGCLLDVAEGAA